MESALAIKLFHTELSMSMCQSQLPSFHPSFHRSSTLLQSNSGFPIRRLTSLCRWQNHCDKLWQELVSGVLFRKLQTNKAQEIKNRTLNILIDTRI